MNADYSLGKYVLSPSLCKKIVDFLISLPNIHDSNALRAFFYSAGIEMELQNQLNFSLPSAQFFHLTVPILNQYGILEDGRHALQALIESAKNYIGQQGRDYCDTLLQELNAAFKQSDVAISPQSAKRPFTYSLRPQVRHFVDREKMRDRLKMDLKDTQKVIIVVDGLAGIGKTSLAAKVAEEVESDFAGIYYTKSPKDADLDRFLSELAYFLAKHGDHFFQRVFEYNIPKENKINFLLGALARQNYLLIFDDVHNLLDNQQSIKDNDLQILFDSLLTQAHQSKILIISRSRPIFHHYRAVQSKNTLESLESEEGIELLQILGIDEDETLLKQAYRLTAGHPLAIELLASLTEIMPIEDILANKVLFYKDIHVTERLLQQLYDTLNSEERKLLFKIAVLPNPVTRDVICKLGEAEDTSDVLNYLVRKALVIYDRQLKVYRQHDLVRDFNNSKMIDSEKIAYHLKAAEYYEELGGNQEELTFDKAQQLLEAQYHYFQSKHYEKACTILIKIAKPLRNWGYLGRCKLLLEEALSTLEQLELARESLLLKVDLLIELGWVETLTASIDKAFERCELAEKILSSFDDERRAGNLYRAKGRFLYSQAKWEESVKYLDLSFNIRKRIGRYKRNCRSPSGSANHILGFWGSRKKSMINAKKA